MILAVDMTNSTPVEHDGITYFVQLGKVKGTDEFHLYLDSDRVIITESDYEACASNEANLKELALKYIKKEIA
ncbi:hypothetical protein [Moritella viscosa]|uniref:Anaerobic nitric oxide reductase transcription regulator norR n=1 Tax=Moritella viscosa TaxID=80854 RepID=A0A1L0APU1_9GAMM|nr:hypothetical protein [Moritella viscosa]SGZ19409.1 Anaerobic nitric oxide reductase transcription regulator norR [Moritella viscosa]SHO28170.1 Anaerobic nitric oxide reductase transcription regulator norR [Moritella viscosa]